MTGFRRSFDYPSHIQVTTQLTVRFEHGEWQDTVRL